MFTRVLTALRDVATYNALLVRSGSFRADAMKAYSEWLLAQRPTVQVRREIARVTPAAVPHTGLSGAALALAATSQSDHTPRRINIVLTDFIPNRAFAGIHTALDVADKLGARTGLPVQLVTLSERFGANEAAEARTVLTQRFARPVNVVYRDALLDTTFNPDDIWVVTHWTTAHPAAVAARAGVIRSENVVYLIQDYEPGFHAWSTAHTVARSTYDAGFHHLVNSAPLAKYLRDTAGVEIDDECVFAPALNIARMQEVARLRERGPVRVLFYGRPSKPRNLFSLGVAAMMDAVQRLGDRAVSVEFISAGEAHDSIDLGAGVQLKSVGALPWDAYFALLPTASVVLSLQASPHPSHPPLEAAVSGAIAVTNEFAQTRNDLHPRLSAVSADPESLGAALTDAINRISDEGPGSYSGLADGILGSEIDGVIDTLAGRIGF
ncbi:rhamnosyltransferase WsaF family glycosyltransferase [Glaciibacter psychrotolerans]|uniref:Glycosyltransferase family 1 protein n=1 Tax=Glaciibacter psychrotolerans TaxID=670054 RepID=A0A7Z0J764_9MICO|nr:hypothetical protein [Leifsonia psychrotolerans]NYJ20599.1 hypothetical protein [Leifsonia psychrotolerans]